MPTKTPLFLKNCYYFYFPAHVFVAVLNCSGPYWIPPAHVTPGGLDWTLHVQKKQVIKLFLFLVLFYFSPHTSRTVSVSYQILSMQSQRSFSRLVVEGFYIEMFSFCRSCGGMTTKVGLTPKLLTSTKREKAEVLKCLPGACSREPSHLIPHTLNLTVDWPSSHLINQSSKCWFVLYNLSYRNDLQLVAPVNCYGRIQTAMFRSVGNCSFKRPSVENINQTTD